MNQRERELLIIEQNFKNKLEKKMMENAEKGRKTTIKDVKIVGDANWKDNSEKVFIVEKEITEVDIKGKKRKIQLTNLYLGDKCVGGTLGDGEIVYSENLLEEEKNKMNELLKNVSEQELQKNSLRNLEKEEVAEILSVYYGKKVTKEDVDKEIEKLDDKDLNKIEQENKQENNKDENSLSENQFKNIEGIGMQKIDLNQVVDGKETLARRLDLKDYEEIYVIFSSKANKITPQINENNTTYSLVGRTKDGEAKVLNDEFEIDGTVGNNAREDSTKIRSNGVATEDSKDLSVYTRKTNGKSIGLENDMGDVRAFFYEKTRKDNKNVGIEVETSETPIISSEVKRVMDRNKGMYQKDKIKEEVKEHVDNNCNPERVEDFDGEENTETHEHLDIEVYVQDILNYENGDGEERIREVFTDNEVRVKFLKEIDKYKDELSMEQIAQNVKEEMNHDAEMIGRKHEF